MNTILVIILFVIITYVILQPKFNEPFYIGVRPKCDPIKPFKNKYRENYLTSNIKNAFICYKDCIDSGECGYVGLGFDCYNNCFDNVDGTPAQNNTLGDYGQ
jgi:hypothetical protein